MEYLHIPRDLVTRESYKNDITPSAKWLYVVLKEVERQRQGTRDYFYITNEELASLSGMSVSALKRAKSQLITVGLVRSSSIHFIVSGAGTSHEKLSKHHVSGYRLLE